VSETRGPDGQGELTKDLNVCPEQKHRTRAVEKELKKLGNRLERDRIASVFHLQLYAFNCGDKRHESEGPHPMHIDYVAGGTRWDVPSSLQAAIRALEHALAELKKKVQ